METAAAAAVGPHAGGARLGTAAEQGLVFADSSGSLPKLTAGSAHAPPDAAPKAPAAEDTSAPLPELSPEAELAALQELSALTGAAAGAGPARRAMSSRRLMSSRNLGSAAGARGASAQTSLTDAPAAEGSDALPAAMLATGGARTRPRLIPLGGGAAGGLPAPGAAAAGTAANGARFGGAPLLSSRSFRINSSRTGSRLANAGRSALGPEPVPTPGEAGAGVGVGVAAPPPSTDFRSPSFGAGTSDPLASPGFASPTAGSEGGYGSSPGAKPLSGMRIGSTRRLLASSSPSWRAGAGGDDLIVPTNLDGSGSGSGGKGLELLASDSSSSSSGGARSAHSGGRLGPVSEEAAPGTAL
jgi:hypothetical protein